MDDIDVFFSKFDALADDQLSNEELQALLPVIERIIGDYQLRTQFFLTFRQINDRDRKLKIIEAFNFAATAYQQFRDGLIDEGELQKMIAGTGGLGLIVGAILGIIPVVGMALPLALPLIIIGAGLVVASVAGYLYFENRNRKAKQAKLIEDLQSFTFRLNQEI